MPYSRVDDPLIRRSLSVIDYFLRDLSRGVSRIQAGEVPDGSGDPLPGSIDTSDFFFLPGRTGGQNAHGSTDAGGDLILHSTASTTLGSIFLGSYSEFDEVNNRLGIYKTSPAAALEVAQAYNPTFFRPIADLSVLDTWRGEGGETYPNRYLHIDDNSDTDYLSQGAGNYASVYTGNLTAGSAPSAGAVHTLRIRVRRVDTGVGAGPDPTFNYDLLTNINTVVTSTLNVVGTTFQTITHVLSAGEIAQINNYALMTFALSGSLASGTQTDYFQVAWIELEVAAVPPTNLTHWDTAAGATVVSIVDNAGKFGIGTGDVALAAWLEVGDGTLQALDILGNSTMQSGGSVPALTIYTELDIGSYFGGGGLNLFDYSNGFFVEFNITNLGLTANRHVSMPDGDGEIVIAQATQTITNKTLSSSTKIRCGAASTDSFFVKQGSTTVGFRFQTTDLSAAQVYRVENLTGTIPLVGDDPPAVAAGAMGKVDATAQAAAIGATNLTNGALTGIYQVNYDLEVTTANVTDVTVQFQISYTDTVGATTQVPVALTLAATGRQTGVLTFYLASGELSYQTNVVTQTTSRYALRVRVLYLG